MPILQKNRISCKKFVVYAATEEEWRLGTLTAEYAEFTEGTRGGLRFFY